MAGKGVLCRCSLFHVALVVVALALAGCDEAPVGQAPVGLPGAAPAAPAGPPGAPSVPPAVPPSAPPTPLPVPPAPGVPSPAAQRWLELVNRDRQEAGLAPVTVDACLQRLAEAWADELRDAPESGLSGRPNRPEEVRENIIRLRNPRPDDGEAVADAHAHVMTVPEQRDRVLLADARVAGAAMATGDGTHTGVQYFAAAAPGTCPEERPAPPVAGPGSPAPTLPPAPGPAPGQGARTVTDAEGRTVELTAVEAAVLDHMNRERTSRGHVPLQPDRCLMEFGRAYAATDPSGHNPVLTETYPVGSTGFASGTNWVQENFGLTAGSSLDGNDPEAVATARVENGWMTSGRPYENGRAGTAHAGNITNPVHLHTGIGLVTTANSVKGVTLFSRHPANTPGCSQPPADPHPHSDLVAAIAGQGQLPRD
jgi:uncharacterized protein YkwD